MPQLRPSRFNSWVWDGADRLLVSNSFSSALLEFTGMTAAKVYGELADLVVGSVAARRDKAERWIFDSTGLAAQDLAAAAMIYELARANEDMPRLQFND